MRWFIAVLISGALSAAQAPWSRLAEASRLVESDPVAARAALEALVLEHPDFAAARFNLGTLLLESDAERAAEHLASATAHPGTALAADAWHNLALARWKQGRLEDAIHSAERALALRPEEADYMQTRDELRRAFLVQQDELRRKREEEARRLRVDLTALPDAREGEAYTGQVAARGGTPPYQFTVEKLPDSLAAAADGTLSGTPTANTRGHHRLTITVTDSAEGSARGEVTLVVLPPPAITTAMLDEALIHFSYRATLSAEGLRDPHWQVAGLPDGLSASERGDITGTPRQAGTFPLHIRAADATHHAERTLELIVSDAFAPDPSRLPPATAWAPYEHRLSVRGPAQRYRWEHPVPTAGLVITPTGHVEGAPEAAGDLTIPVRIVAEDGRSRDVSVILPVNPPPVIAEEERITVEQGKLLNRPLRLEGGTAPFTWAGSGGPAGVRVDPDGHLRGAATAAGSSELIITVTDRWQASSQLTVTIEVTEPPEPQDQQDQEQEQEQEQEQQQQDQQQQDQQQQDQQQQDQQQQDQQQQDQQQQDQQQQDQQQQDQQQQDQQPQDAGEPQPVADRAETLSREAADRWLEQLPAEDRDVLRLQLLHDQQRPANTGKDPW